MSLKLGAFNVGNVKHTYGTGCFLMMNIGETAVINTQSNLISTVLFKLGKDKPTQYALEVKLNRIIKFYLKKFI